MVLDVKTTLGGVGHTFNNLLRKKCDSGLEIEFE